MASKIQLRRDTLANFNNANVILANGEPAFCTDTKDYRIGDGSTAFNALPIFAKRSEVAAAIAAADAAATSATAANTAATNAQTSATAAQTSATAANTAATSAQTAIAALTTRVTALETTIDGGNAAG